MGEEQNQAQQVAGFVYEPKPSLRIEHVTGGFVITGWSPPDKRLHAVASNDTGLARVVRSWANGLGGDG